MVPAGSSIVTSSAKLHVATLSKKRRVTSWNSRHSYRLPVPCAVPREERGNFASGIRASGSAELGGFQLAFSPQTCRPFRRLRRNRGEYQGISCYPRDPPMPVVNRVISQPLQGTQLMVQQVSNQPLPMSPVENSGNLCVTEFHQLPKANLDSPKGVQDNLFRISPDHSFQLGNRKLGSGWHA